MNTTLKTFLTLALLAISLTAYSQDYNSLLKEGDKLYNEGNYYEAYLRYNAAKVFAGRNEQWKKAADDKMEKSAKALNQQLIACQRQKEIEDSIRTANEKLRASVLAQLPLPRGVSNAYDYYLPQADTLYAQGNYQQALIWYKLLVQLQEATKYKQAINEKISNAPVLQAKITEADTILMQGQWQKARDLYSYVLQTNKSDIACTQRMRTIDLIQKGELIFVKGGTFMMGDEKGDLWDGCRPVHKVTLSNYYIGKTEVTNRMYADFLNEYKSETVKTGDYKGQKMIYEYETGGLVKKDGTWQPENSKDNYPVIGVTWYGAYEYCEFYGLSLPTEAQWEYAARGGTSEGQNGRMEYAGSNNLSDVGWYWSNSRNSENKMYKRRGTHPVAQLKPNQLGIYDMTGNVLEWCNDWYGDYTDKEQTNPIASESGSGRVSRGGSWYNNANSCRVANRSYWYPNNRDSNLGFRACLVP